MNYCALALSFLLALPAFAADPLPFFHPNDVVLFQGDSITDGGRWREGSDLNHILGQDYGYILAAHIDYLYPERNLTFLNRGDGGDKVSDLAGRWQKDTLDLHPNVLSILVGVNDMQGKTPADQFEKTYDKLLRDTIAALPGVKIILGEPFVLPVGKFKDHYPDWRAQLKERQETVARLAAKYHLPLIPYQEAFDAACKRAPADHWSWDGIHATYGGHELMAQEWLKTAKAFWP